MKKGIVCQGDFSTRYWVCWGAFLGISLRMDASVGLAGRQKVAAVEDAEVIGYRVRDIRLDIDEEPKNFGG